MSSSLPVGKAASPEPAKPKPISASLIPPSTEVKPVTAVPFHVNTWFTLAVPNKTIPPQSPDAGFGWAEVNTIGFSAVPFATILAPRVITKADTFAPDLPCTLAPASIVSVTPFVTYTIPER